MTTTPTCEICDKPLEYSGRGRPPKRCSEHKNVKEAPKQEEKKVEGARPRPRPGARPAPSAAKSESKADTPAESESSGLDEGVKDLPPLGEQDTQSRAKAQTAANRTSEQSSEVEQWPVNGRGRPLTKIVFSASELIPTGQYANVSVGPAQIHTFVDMDRVAEDGSYFSDSEKQTLTTAMNELAEVVERDVVAVQRNLVLESIQEQLSTNGKS